MKTSEELISYFDISKRVYYTSSNTLNLKLYECKKNYTGARKVAA